MPEDERRTRMEGLRRRVMTHDVHWWARTFLARLERSAEAGASATAASPRAAIAAAVARARAAARLVLLLDYDGTLVPFAPTPDLAAPDPALGALLAALAARPGTEVHVVSGRRRDTLERWLGALPIGLHAEHGHWSRRRGGAWTAAEVGPTEWREPVLAILRDFAERTPGSLVEEKTASVAWHYRSSDPEYGASQANELSLHLSTLLSNVPVQIFPGDRVLEVRPHGADKGRIARSLAAGAAGALMVALGDDRTDEDLFAALPEGSVVVHVGAAPSRAPLRVRDVREARALLQELVRG
jgi:trehalose 6-phosphate synthase/phosphatase